MKKYTIRRDSLLWKACCTMSDILFAVKVVGFGLVFMLGLAVILSGIVS